MRRALLVVLLAAAPALALAQLAQTELERDLAACRTVAESGARLACYDALAQRPPEATVPKQTRLKGAFSGWSRKFVLELENGQVWRYAGYDDSYRAAPLENPEVTLEKSFSGAWWMTIAGEPRTGKVTRLR